MAVSRTITNLLARYCAPAAAPRDGEKIKVHNVISMAAFVYEKVRNAVDYNEEHLVCKNAIYRILKRKLVLEKVLLENYLLEKYHQDNVAEHLLQELIRGRYVDNNVSVSMIAVVDRIICKYNYLIAKIKEQGGLEQKTFNYFLEMAAVEIEAALIPATKENALIRAMFAVFNSRIQLPRASEQEQKEKELQVYLGSHRALFKQDDSMLRFLLLKLYYPQWSMADEPLLKQVADRERELRTDIDRQIAHPLRKQINAILQKNAILFLIVQDIIEAKGSDATAIFNNPEELENEIRKACDKRYKSVGVKLRRGMVRSITYVFFTKMILALAIELPMDVYLAGMVNYESLGVNVLFPPTLMLFVSLFIRMPKKQNTSAIVSEIKNIAFQDATARKYVLKPITQKGGALNLIFNLIYAATFVGSLFVIFWVLNRFDFNVFSSLIFVLFLTLVAFFGIRIRRPVKDLIIVERKESALGAVVDFFALPFISMGRWMSVKFSKINFLAFFMDFIIEAPFKLLIEIIEDMFAFLKEKKEDVLNE